jgi:hypothetical protein
MVTARITYVKKSSKLMHPELASRNCQTIRRARQIEHNATRRIAMMPNPCNTSSTMTERPELNGTSIRLRGSY